MKSLTKITSFNRREGEKMRVTKIRLQNYRNHADTALDLGDSRFIVVRGRNASGKTTIAEALSVNTTLTTVSLGTQGKDFVSKIRQGEKKAVVTCEIQGQHLLRNVVTLNVNTSGRTSTTECVDEPENNKAVKGFKNFLSDRKEAILISFNTDYFNSLDQKGQTNLLAKLVLPAHYEFPKDKTELVNSFLDTPIDFNGEPFDVIASSYKQLYKVRETVNRQCKDFTIPESLPIIQGVDSESLQTQLTGIREQRTKLQADRDAAVAKANEVEVKRGRLQTKIDNLHTQLEREKEKLANTELSVLLPENVDALNKISSHKEELAQLNLQRSAYTGVIKVTNQQIDRLTGIAESGATCPTCDQQIDKEKIESLVSELKEEVVKAQKEIDAIDEKINAIGNVQEAINSINEHDDAVKEKAKIEASLCETVKEGKKIRAELNALGEKVDATLPFNDPLSNLQVQEDKIVEQLRPVISAEERAKEIVRLTEQLTKLQKKALTLDSLVKYFDKDGIKAELVKKYIGGFEEKINSVLAAWGYKSSLSPDLSSFDVTTPRGYIGPVKELSGAEEHIFKAAFQCAVSIAAGINLVVIDEVEELGSDIQQALFATVYSLIQSNKLDQAILIGFSLDKTLPNPQAPGSLYFYVENGTVEILQ